ncbi:MAG: FecR domain-containing protein [Proteobacteria bacterium]|nr:FecR domain-containing protein [Pseudomonadota bacterium]
MRTFTEQEQSIEDQAAFWLVRLCSEGCTPEDRFAFEAWKEEDPAHERLFLQLQRGNAVVDRHMTDPRIVAMLEEARAEGQAGLGRRMLSAVTSRSAGGLAALAASIVIAFAAALVAVPAFRGAALDAPPQTAQTPGSVEVFETSVGERSTITLADGSTVSINTNSLVEVSFSATERLVRLARGQAYFEVRQDVARPFVVQAGDQRVVALGTAFDVRFDREDLVEITLVEGRVRVNDVSRLYDTSPATGDRAIPDPIELAPGQRLIAKAASAPEIVATDTVEETSWRNGQLVFRKRPLAGVVEEMNRYSVQNLVLADDLRVRNLEVSGVFNSGGRASSFVNALEALYPLEAERTERDEITLVWRE